MKTDFHVHSSASDGTVAPAELAQRAQHRGFRAIALTDHDNCDGIAEFLSAKEAGSPTALVPGIELSIEPGKGYDKFHLLGLGVDHNNEGLRKFLRRILEGRNARNARILENFARLGIEIAADDIATYAHGEVLARPHFAKWLVDHGYAGDITAAFGKYLLPDSPAETRAYEDRWHPAQEDAFNAIHAAGGICIMAHPKYWRREWRNAAPDCEVALKELLRLKEIGLDGIEALYEANFPREDVAWTMVAGRAGLLKSAGSDFHGANKPNIRLGMDVEPGFVEPLLDRLGA